MSVITIDPETEQMFEDYQGLDVAALSRQAISVAQNFPHRYDQKVLHKGDRHCYAGLLDHILSIWYPDLEASKDYMRANEVGKKNSSFNYKMHHPLYQIMYHHVMNDNTVHLSNLCYKMWMRITDGHRTLPEIIFLHNQYYRDNIDGGQRFDTGNLKLADIQEAIEASTRSYFTTVLDATSSAGNDLGPTLLSSV